MLLKATSYQGTKLNDLVANGAPTQLAQVWAFECLERLRCQNADLARPLGGDSARSQLNGELAFSVSIQRAQ